jgi:sulfide dehydrogenase cytochrome subunit
MCKCDESFDKKVGATVKTANIQRLVAIGLLTASALASAQTDLAARSMAASCANCHGTNGVAQPGMVALAGYDKAGLIRAMAEFKSGARPATIMHQLAKGYTEAQIEAIAGYFAAQKK